MKLIAQVDHAVAFQVDYMVRKRIFVGAHGHVSSSGWSAPCLAPRFYITPPADGIWDFDFFASEPSGLAAQVQLPIAAAYEGDGPGWIRGVRVHAAGNDIVVNAFAGGKVATVGRYAVGVHANAIVEQAVAIYDDSFQPTGTIHWDGGFIPLPHVEMKKLRHELTLIIEGPDEGQIRRCIDTSLAAGAVAALIAAFATGGWGAAEAFAATALSTLEGCLGAGFSVRLNDRSHWITWDT